MEILNRIIRIRILYVAAVAAPLLLLIIFIMQYSVNIPFWDQWELVPVLEGQKHGGTLFHELWAQHNEHRIFFPMLLMLALANLSHWNIVWEITTSIFLDLASFCLLTLSLKNTFINKSMFFWAPTLLAWIFFSTNQWENWLWGWQVQWFMSVFGVVLALWALQYKWKHSSLGLAVAIIGGVLATYSLANGQFVWLAGLIGALFSGRSRKDIIVWVCTGVLFTSMYYVGFNLPLVANKTLFLKEPFRFSEYVLSYLGGWSGGYGHIALITGFSLTVVLLASLVWIIKKNKNQLQGVAVWAGLAAYSGASAVAAGIGRLDLGVQQAVSSRYMTVSALFVVATLVISGLAVTNLSTRRHRLVLPIFTIFVICILALEARSYVAGVSHMRDFHNKLIGTQQCIVEVAALTDPCLKETYPWPEILWPRLKYIKDNRLSVFN